MNRRLFPLTGVAFFVLFLVASILGTGGDSAATRTAVSYYVAHQSQIRTSFILLMIAVVALIFFTAYLYSVIREVGDGGQLLASAIPAGGAIWATGLFITAMTHDAFLYSAVDGQVGVANTLHALGNSDFYPMIGGLAITLLAAGIAAAQGAALPAWLGWIAILIGLLALAGPLGMIAFLAAPFWILIASIILATRGDPTETAAVMPETEPRASRGGAAAS